jgi:NTE family protein
MARSLGRNTVLLWTSPGTRLDGKIPPTALQDFYSLGGFLNLSGLAPQSLTGPNYAIVRTVYFRKIGRGGEGCSIFRRISAYRSKPATPMRSAATSASTRRTRTPRCSWASIRLLGPLYIGTGYDEIGHSAFYLFLGRTF